MMISPIMEVVDKDVLTEKIIGCCFKVHTALGPGFIEKIYAKALQHQLKKEGLSFEVEKELMSTSIRNLLVNLDAICLLKTVLLLN